MSTRIDLRRDSKKAEEESAMSKLRITRPLKELVVFPPPSDRPMRWVPSIAWRDAFDQHFRNLRSHIWDVDPLTLPTLAAAPIGYAPFPKKKDVAGWKAYIHGQANAVTGLLPAWLSENVGDETPSAIEQVEPTQQGEVSGYPTNTIDHEEIPGSQNLASASDDLIPSEPVTGHMSMSQDQNSEDSDYTADEEESGAQEALLSQCNAIENEAKASELGPPCREPQAALLNSLSDQAIMLLIQHMMDWIRDEGFTALYARWIFGMLLFLTPDVDGDDVSTLRELCRACLRTSASTTDAESQFSVWMVVSAVSDVWRQSDLWDEAQYI